jgi:hypothetical protein
VSGQESPELHEHNQPAHPKGAVPIGSLIPGRTATVVGRLHDISTRTRRGRSVLTGEVADESGSLTVQFHGGHDDIAPGQQIRLSGRVQLDQSTEAVLMTDPRYEIIEESTGGHDTDPGSAPTDSGAGQPESPDPETSGKDANA